MMERKIVRVECNRIIDYGERLCPVAKWGEGVGGLFRLAKFNGQWVWGLVIVMATGPLVGIVTVGG